MGSFTQVTKSRCAVLARIGRARAELTPASSTTIRSVPSGWTSGSLTPKLLSRFWKTWTAIAWTSLLVRPGGMSVSWISMWLPPWMSRPLWM